MGILAKKVRNFFRQTKEDIANSEFLTDDVRDGKFDLVDAKKDTEKHREELLKLKVHNKGFKRREQELKDKVKKHQNLAEQALERGMEDKASEALTIKRQAEGELKEIKKQIAENNSCIEQQQKIIDNRKAQTAQAESLHAQLAARQAGNKARKAWAKKSAGHSSENDPLAALSSLQDKINAEDDEIAILEEEAGVGKLSLEEEITGGADAGVDDELAALKAKMAAKKEKG